MTEEPKEVRLYLVAGEGSTAGEGSIERKLIVTDDRNILVTDDRNILISGPRIGLAPYKYGLLVLPKDVSNDDWYIGHNKIENFPGGLIGNGTYVRVLVHPSWTEPAIYKILFMGDVEHSEVRPHNEYAQLVERIREAREIYFRDRKTAVDEFTRGMSRPGGVSIDQMLLKLFE